MIKSKIIKLLKTMESNICTTCKGKINEKGQPIDEKV
jgi:hypothetical protein